MPTRVPGKYGVVFKRTDDEKKLHNMSKELSKTTDELAQAKKDLASLSGEIAALKSLLEGKK